MGILLLVTVFLPLVGAALCVLGRARVRQTALVVAVATFVLAAVLISLGSWILYFSKIMLVGIAVPEIIASIAATSWLVEAALRIYMDNVSR